MRRLLGDHSGETHLHHLFQSRVCHAVLEVLVADDSLPQVIPCHESPGRSSPLVAELPVRVPLCKVLSAHDGF